MLSDVFNGARLETLRLIHGLSQSEFGKRLEITQSRLSRLERGDLVLTDELAVRASAIFGEPLSFFTVPSAPIPLGPVAFRRKSATRAAEKHRTVALFQEAARVFHRVSEQAGYHQVHSVADQDLAPEAAAQAVRGAAGLAVEQPVRNVARLLERLGIGVITHLDDEEFARDIADVSGIAMPTALNRRPLVATNPIARGDVQRLTIAHELGHIILDRHAPAISCAVRSTQERAAFDFGAALLLPARVVERRIDESSTLRDYLELKAEFGLSASAAVGRAYRLGAITEERRRTLTIQHSSRGWRYDEPVQVEVERPLLFQQAVAKAYPTSTYARASFDLGVRPDRLRRWAGRPDEEGPPANVTRLRAG